MATWPANGETDWNTAMLAWLAVSFNANGTLSDITKLILTPASELTIAAGVITVTGSFHKIDTAGDAASDDLDTINGGTDGQILILRAEDTTRTVVVKDGTGNMNLNGDFSLDNFRDTITLILDGATWIELSRSNNSI